MMRRSLAFLLAAGLVPVAVVAAPPFEGRIEVIATRGGKPETLHYRIGPGTLRIEAAGEGTVAPVNLVDLKTGTLTVLYSRTATYTRKARTAETAETAETAKVNGAITVPSALPSTLGAPGVANLPAMPSMTPPPELKPMGKHQKLLGYDCECFEISERGETVEIWATAGLVPFQPYVRDPSPHFGPRSLEEMWSEALATRRLFPLRAVLHDETPDARTVFEVKTIAPGKIEPAESQKLFQTPESYAENPARPF